MSGFLKSIGKAFKKIVKSPIFKAVAIGAAIYFTGGLALGAMGGAVLPGVGALASGLGITAGSFGAAAAGTVGIASSAVLGASGLAEMATAGLATEGIAGTIASTASGLAASGGLLTGAAEMAAGGVATPGISSTIASTAASGGSSWFGGLTTGAKDFFGSTFGQKLVGEAISQGGKAILGGMAQKAEDERYQQSREDAIRRGSVPDIRNQYETPKAAARPGEIGQYTQIGGGIGGGGTGSYRTGYRTPGIVDRVLQEEPKKNGV